MKKVLLFLFLLIGGLETSFAQCGKLNETIKAGETLSYELKFNWKFIWINAGWAKMTVSKDVYNDQPVLRTDLESYTNKKIDFFFKMRDTLTCITKEDLTPLKFRKGAEEGRHYSVDEINFSYRDSLCIVDQSRSWDYELAYSKHEELPYCVYDMLSIMLQARSLDVSDYTPGQQITFYMATGRRVEEQHLIYRKKANYKMKDGNTYRCLVFSLVEYDKKGKEKEVITFYVTDDKNHLPIRLDMYLNFGSAKAFLTEVQGNAHPLTSIVEK